MEQRLIRFFSKNNIKPTDIMYVYREDRKTCICLKNQQLLQTNIPMKWFLAALPDGAYLHINKSVILASSHIDKIEGNLYMMKDGKIFSGRVRTAGVHNQNRRILKNEMPQVHNKMEQSVFQQFSVMDNLPVPFCVVELIINSGKRDVDFIFRYCNQAMAELGGFSREPLIDQPCQDIFYRRESKWILTFIETALTGKTTRLDDIQLLSGNKLRVHCFQPAKNLCACILIEYDD